MKEKEGKNSGELREKEKEQNLCVKTSKSELALGVELREFVLMVDRPYFGRLALLSLMI